MNALRLSLYDEACLPVHAVASSPSPDPWTIETASAETIDNDRAAMMLDAGVIR